MKIRTRAPFLLALSILLTFVQSANAQSPLPTLKGVVTDLQGSLKGQETWIESEATGMIAESNGKISRIFVLLVPNIGAYKDAATYGNELFASNGLKEGDVILWASFEKLTSMNNLRPLMITTSGQTSAMFDAMSTDCKKPWRQYITDRMVPYFQSSKFADGVVGAIRDMKGVSRENLRCNAVEQPAPAQQSQPIQPASQQQWLSNGDRIVVALCIVVLAIVFLVWLAGAIPDSPIVVTYDEPRSRRKRRRSKIDVWEPTYTPTHTWPSPPKEDNYGADSLGSIMEAIGGAISATAESGTTGLGSTSESSSPSFSFPSSPSSGGSGW